jgi:hypothetical protein
MYIVIPVVFLMKLGIDSISVERVVLRVSFTEGSHCLGVEINCYEDLSHLIHYEEIQIHHI